MKYMRALFYLKMYMIRRATEKVVWLMKNKIISDFVSLPDGQEAVAVGVVEALEEQDYIVATHRYHHWYIARTLDLLGYFAELVGKEGGSCRGWGGVSMAFNKEYRYMGGSTIVGAAVPLATGIANAIKIRGEENTIAVAVFSDGASEEGVFYESLNVAAILDLPVLYIAENNQYATHAKVTDWRANPNIWEIAKAIGVEARRVDGNDVEQVYNAAREARKYIIEKGKPYLLECLTYRLRGHSGYGYDIGWGLRTEEEIEEWKKKDPLKRLEAKLDRETIETIRGFVDAMVDSAFIIVMNRRNKEVLRF